MLQRGKIEFGLREGLLRGQETDLGSGLLACRARFLQPGQRLTVGERHGMLLAAAPDAHGQRFRQGVDDRHPDPVQAARDFVGILIELTAGMELGHDDLGRRDTFLGMDFDRDAATVVEHRHRSVGI